ncbi:calcium and integrin-binding family member 2-like isoform X2 [Pectinophora gossypiella]|nr:calcium and integrin-binding family member 2-like isoform X2 [Pectinophora gossypiella]
MKKFYSIDPEKLKANPNHRFSKEDIIKKFHVLENNPFQDRIFRVFSSQRDNCFSFEDMLDLYSAVSSDCPREVKAVWAFRIYDINEDNQITKSDIIEILDRLTGHLNDRNDGLESQSKIKIAKLILEELSLDNTGSIGLSEFKIMMARIPEFANSFYFRL